MNGPEEMFLNLCLLLVFLGHISCYENGHIFGVIQRQGEEIEEELFRKVLQKELQSDRVYINFQTITEVVPQEDAWYYHRAVCRLLEKGVQVIVSPTSFPTFPLLASYSNEFKFPFISPELPEAPDDAPDLIAKYGFGIRPSTTRASLDLIRYFGWQNLVYIYDDDFGPEKLQIMFRVAYSVLNLHLVGFLKTTSAEDTLKYLRKLDQSSTHKVIPVLLDVDPSLATEILLRFVHDVGGRKDKYSFLLIQPTLEDFWTENEAEFRILNITGFLTVQPDFKRFNSVEEEWRKLYYYKGPFPKSNLKLSYYYYHDAALVLARAVQSLPAPRVIHSSRKIAPKKFPGCFHEPHTDLNFGYPYHIRVLKNVRVSNGLTGRIEFEKWNETQSKRINFNLTIGQSTSTGYQELGIWSSAHHGLHLSQKPLNDQPGALPQVDNKLRVTSKLDAPYLMLKTGDNVSHLQGNDRFEGYCKDMMDTICEYMQVECELKIVEDGQYGRYEPNTGRWTGMVGELIQGKADIAISDLFITGERQRVVDFTDAYEMVSFSLLMKNPDSIGTSSSVFFIFNAFSVNVWICILVAFVLFCAFLQVTTTFTGAPDSIESASGIWGRKNRIVVNVWFSVGSTLMQGTGVYPRSISSRILSGGWWFFTSVMTCMFIASLIFQLQVQNTTNENSLSLMQLKSLSVESIIHESVENGWPKIGLIYPSSTSRFIKGSTLPLYKKYETFMENNPSVYVSDREEGIERVRKSSGGYVLLLDSTKSDYETRRSPCDLVATQDPYIYGGYGVATPFKSPLRHKVNEALSTIAGRGLLGHLHRKWWIDSSQCKNGIVETSLHGALHSFSGLFYILLIGCAILVTVIIIQYFRKIQHREDRMQQLTFDDRTLEHHLPDPPPELLENPPPVLNLPEIEKRDFCDSENFNDFFERMKTGR